MVPVVLLPVVACAPADAAAEPPATGESANVRPVASPSPPTPGDDWPGFLGPDGDSQSKETGIITARDENGPPLVWHRKLDQSYGIGSVANGRFYQFDGNGRRGRLLCLDAETGKLIWEFEYPTEYEDLLGYNNGPRASPVISDGMLYTLGAEGMLHGLRESDGSVVWKVDTTKEFGVVQNFFGVGSSPVVEGDLLIVLVGGSPPESREAGRFSMDRVAGNGTGIVAFDKHTGEVKYAITDELASYSTPQLATIGGRHGSEAELRCIEWRTGRVMWGKPGLTRTSLLYADGHFVCLGEDGILRLVKATPERYEEIARAVIRETPGGAALIRPPAWAAPILAHGLLYIRGDDRLACLRLMKGVPAE